MVKLTRWRPVPAVNVTGKVLPEVTLEFVGVMVSVPLVIEVVMVNGFCEYCAIRVTELLGM